MSRQALPAGANDNDTFWWLAGQLQMDHSIYTQGSTGFVYFATDDELVKIGFSGAPALRVKRLMHERPKPKNPVKLLSSARGTMGHERLFHALFWEQWQEREWFFPSPEVIEAFRQAEAGMSAEDILLFHVGRLRKPFGAPRQGPANRTHYDEEVIVHIKGGVETYETIRHPKGTLPAPVWCRDD